MASPCELADLKGGDQLTAAIITSGPPEVLTSTDVQAVLDIPEPTPAEVVAATPDPAPAPASAEAPAAAGGRAQSRPRRRLRQLMSPVVAATEEPATTEEKPDRTLIWILLGVIVLVGAFLLIHSPQDFLEALVVV